MKVYLFEFGDTPFEPLHIVSIHTSRRGAYRAMLAHKHEQWYLCRDYLRVSYDETFGDDCQWQIREFEVTADLFGSGLAERRDGWGKGSLPTSDNWGDRYQSNCIRCGESNCSGFVNNQWMCRRYVAGWHGASNPVIPIFGNSQFVAVTCTCDRCVTAPRA